MTYQLQIGQILRTPLATAPEQCVHHGDAVTLTYRQVADRVARLGAALGALGLGPGATVAVMDWDSHRYFECYFGVPMLGATLHMINVRLAPEQVRYTIDHAEDDAILVHEDFLPLLLPLLPKLARRPRLILLTDRGAAVPDGFEGEYEALLAAQEDCFAFPDLDEGTRATLFYTTGTTGQPKGVSYSHRQIVLHTLGALAALGPVPGQGGLKKNDVYMPVTPLFHVHGWGFPYVATMLGLKQVYPGRYEPARLLRLIETHGVTFSHFVPTILAMLLNAPEARGVDLSRLKVLIGGSALPEGLARSARARGIDVHAAYGMSETCPLLTTADMVASQASDEVTIRTATGKPTPMVDLRIVDGEMNDVAHDGRTTGEVVVRAPWLTEGYLKDPEGTGALWRGGWLHTGDVGHLSPDGTLRITDRLKDVIKSGGEWVSSLQLEDIASTVPGLAEVAAIGVPDARWGERPVLVVACGAAEEERVAQDIRAVIDAAIARGDLPGWAAPDRIVRVEALPKTSVGKIDKKAIRANVAAGVAHG